MDSKGRTTAGDINERDMLRAINEGRVFDGYPHKVIKAKAAKLIARGLIRLGGDSEGPVLWVTDKGREVIAGVPAVAA